MDDGLVVRIILWQVYASTCDGFFDDQKTHSRVLKGTRAQSDMDDSLLAQLVLWHIYTWVCEGFYEEIPPPMTSSDEGEPERPDLVHSD